MLDATQDHSPGRLNDEARDDVKYDRRNDRGSDRRDRSRDRCRDDSRDRSRNRSNDRRDRYRDDSRDRYRRDSRDRSRGRSRDRVSDLAHSYSHDGGNGDRRDDHGDRSTVKEREAWPANYKEKYSEEQIQKKKAEDPY
jgi:hypothetical protein